MIMGLEKKLHHSNVGRRTRKNVLEGKIVSKYNNRYNSKEQILQNCKVVLLRNRKIDIMARSIKIHSSNWLNENSHSGSITCFKKIKEKCFSDSEKIFLQKSSEILSNAFANKVGGLPLSTDNANSKNTLSYKINNGIKFKTNKDSFMNEVTVLSSNKKSNLKETQGKEIDAPHNTRNSSRRKSPILFNASSWANNKEKVIKKNSEIISSQGVVFDHREKIFLKNNITLNNSERENALKLNMQNSSTAMSLVATKRNSKALKDKSSKFINIENSSDKANGRSSLGKRSILPVAELTFGNESDSDISEGEISPLEEKTSKIPSSFKETPEEKKNSVYHLRNSSLITEYSRFFSDSSSIEEEVLPSEEKANKISSSLKETPGEKIPQVLWDTSSVSNYSSVRRRNSGGASTQVEMLNLMDASYNLKCRPHKFPLINCSADEGNKQNSPMKSTQSVLSSEELSEEGITLSRKNGTNHIKKTTISLENTGEKVKVQVNYPFNTCQFTVPPIESGNITMCKHISSTLTKFGLINIPPHGMKNLQISDDSNIHFVVLQGVVDAVIASSCFTFRKCDSFVVPVNVAYSLKNNCSSKALLNFCAFKLPIFKHQVYKCHEHSAL